jgi:diamine N-acetyltransferase
MIEGNLIRLRPVCDADLATIAELRNNVRLQAQLITRARGSSINDVREWLLKRKTSPEFLIFAIAESQSDDCVGYIQFDKLSLVDRRVELGICIAPARQGKGIGSEVIELSKGYLRDAWGVRKVSIGVLADNEPAIAVYLKCGFKECGRMREHFLFGGIWKDVIMMEAFLEGAP